MSEIFEASALTGMPYVGKKFRCEETASTEETMGQWTVVSTNFSDMSTVTHYECWSEREAIMKMEELNLEFEIESWKSMREWFNWVDNSVRGDDLRKDHTHLWFQFLGLRNAMSAAAWGTIGINWTLENTIAREA